MSNQELDPVECHMMGMSIDEARRNLEIMAHSKIDEADGGVNKPSPSSQIPSFVTERMVKIVPND